jgi:hypothetical protein
MLPAQDAGLQISPPPPQSEPIPSSVSTHPSNLLPGNFDTGGWLQDVSVTSERPPNFSTAGNPPQPSLSIINGVPSEPIPLSKSPQSYSPHLEISILLNPCSCLMHLATARFRPPNLSYQHRFWCYTSSAAFREFLINGILSKPIPSSQTTQSHSAFTEISTLFGARNA